MAHGGHRGDARPSPRGLELAGGRRGFLDAVEEDQDAVFEGRVASRVNWWVGTHPTGFGFETGEGRGRDMAAAVLGAHGAGRGRFRRVCAVLPFQPGETRARGAGGRLAVFVGSPGDPGRAVGGRVGCAFMRTDLAHVRRRGPNVIFRAVGWRLANAAYEWDERCA